MDKSKSQFKTVDEYINLFPTEVKEILQTLRKTIREVAPEAEEKISYQMPAYMLNGPLIYFGAWKDHIAIYPTGSSMVDSIKEVEKYRTGKGTLKFPLDKPFPFPLIKKIIKFRLAENLKKK